jgi:ECF transporter S component (folate family)
MRDYVWPYLGGYRGCDGGFFGRYLFPIGTYFPGLTLSAALVGIVFGLFLYKRKEGWLPLAGAVAINCLIISLLLNTYWLTILMGKGFMVLLPVRIVQNLIMIPIQFFVIRLLQRPVAIYAHKQAA